MKPLCIAGRTFHSRLFIGTGKFGSHDLMRQAIQESGCELVTVALRRVDLDKNPTDDPLISKLDPEKVVIVPNTSGARTAEEAVRIARLARAAGGFDWVKLELTPNLHHLLPDPIETLKAAEILVKEGYTFRREGSRRRRRCRPCPCQTTRGSGNCRSHATRCANRHKPGITHT